MSYKPGDVLDPVNYDYIKEGLPTTFFKTACTDKMKRITDPVYTPTGQKNKLQLAARKTTYRTIFFNNGISVKDGGKFCRPHYLIAAKIRRQTVCPWFDDHRSIKLQLVVDYGESINPSFPDSVPSVTIDDVWNFGTVYSRDFTSGSCTGTLGFTQYDTTRPRQGSGNVKVELLQDDPTNTCEAPLIQTTWTWTAVLDPSSGFSGGGPIQIIQRGCEHLTSFDTNFITRSNGLGVPVSAGWVVVVHPAILVNPGYIRGLTARIQANGWND